MFLVGLLLAAVPLTPIGAEVERLFGPWLGWQQDREPVAAPPTDLVRSTLSEAAAGRGDLQSEAKPAWAGEDFAAVAGPRPAAPAVAVATPAPVPEDPAARSVPVPALKPPLRDR